MKAVLYKVLRSPILQCKILITLKVSLLLQKLCLCILGFDYNSVLYHTSIVELHRRSSTEACILKQANQHHP